MLFPAYSLAHRLLVVNPRRRLYWKKKSSRSSIIWPQWHTVRQRQRPPCRSARYFLACSTILRLLRQPSTRAYFLECSTIFHRQRPPSRQASSTIGKNLRRPSTFLKPCSTRQSVQLWAVTGPSLKFPLLGWRAKTRISSRTWSIQKGLSP